MKTYGHVHVYDNSLAEFFTESETFQIIVVEEIETHFMISIFFLEIMPFMI